MTEEFDFKEGKPIVVGGIIPILSFPAYLTGRMSNNSKGLDILSITSKLKCNHHYLQTGEPNLANRSFYNSNINDNYSFNFVMDRITIEALEKKRSDDIEFQIEIHILYQMHFENNISKIGKSQTQLQYSLSQKQWIELLDSMGYGEIWIFEVAKLNIEGMPEVMKHLTKAKSNLIAHSYEDCMTNVRSAWNSFTPLWESKKDELSAALDKNDKKEEDYDPKSKRVEEMQKKVVSFTQIGVHRENYVATYWDAELSFYQSISLISYLSRLIKQLPEN